MKVFLALAALAAIAAGLTDPMDKMALDHLFESTGGNHNGMYMMMGGYPWTNGKTGPGNWTYGDPCDDSWYGITCIDDAGTGRVTEINLSDNHLYGYIASEISYLSELTVLDLSNNDLTQGIPGDISMLANLVTVRLSNNRLGGVIPNRLDNNTALEVFDVAHNGIGGALPSQLGDLASITELHLQNNSLVGSLPAYLHEGLPTLTDLTVGANNWYCPVPAALETRFPSSDPNCGCPAGEVASAEDAECADCPEDTFNANWLAAGESCRECTGDSTAEPGSTQCRLNLTYEEPAPEWLVPTAVLGGSALIAGGLVFFAYKQVTSPELRTKKKKKIPEDPKSEAGDGEKPPVEEA